MTCGSVLFRGKNLNLLFETQISTSEIQLGESECLCKPFQEQAKPRGIQICTVRSRMDQKAKALPWLGWRSSGGAGSEGFCLEVLSGSCPGCCPSCRVTSVPRCPLAAIPLPGLPPGSRSDTGSPWRGQRCIPSLGHLRPQPGPCSRAQPQLPKAACVPGRNISCRDRIWSLTGTVTSTSGTPPVSIPGSPRTQFQ